MKLHSNVFGWEYTWQEFANDLGGATAENPDANPSMQHIEIPRQRLGGVKFIPVAAGTKNASFCAICHVDPANDFLFNLHDESFFGGVAKLISGQDIRIGDEDLDHKFIIQSNNNDLIKRFLSNTLLKERLLSRQHMLLQTMKPGSKMLNVGAVPDGAKILYYRQQQFPTRYEELEEIFKLFILAATLTDKVLSQPVEIQAAVSKTIVPESLLHH